MKGIGWSSEKKIRHNYTSDIIYPKWTILKIKKNRIDVIVFLWDPQASDVARIYVNFSSCKKTNRTVLLVRTRNSDYPEFRVNETEVFTILSI